jgi:hypothetical protein
MGQVCAEDQDKHHVCIPTSSFRDDPDDDDGGGVVPPEPFFPRSPCQSESGQILDDGQFKECIFPAGSTCVCDDGKWRKLGRFAVASAGLEAKTGSKKGAEEFFLKAGVNATA